MQMDVNGTIGKAVADYTGGTVLELDVVPDPNVPGAYAIQATVRADYFDPPQVGVAQFLLSGVPVQKVTEDDLEEVEFTAWPPTAK